MIWTILEFLAWFVLMIALTFALLFVISAVTGKFLQMEEWGMSRPRLTKEQKAEIIAAYLRGDSVKLIAHQYGVHDSYPSLLAKRRNLKSRNKSTWMTA